ncbi:hypothetical protein LZ554_002106 [Drepanopeziza brunnea f. sp. 'monogermtubi']|nr:hypothetical protein LZ554_002106 [Drepanopeziza brunnea f. sp. 'monogermtubi']
MPCLPIPIPIPIPASAAKTQTRRRPHPPRIHAVHAPTTPTPLVLLRMPPPKVSRQLQPRVDVRPEAVVVARVVVEAPAADAFVVARWVHPNALTWALALTLARGWVLVLAQSESESDASVA